MADFDKKAKPIQKMLQTMVGKKIDGKSCAWCGSIKVKPEDFRDEISRKEFGISRFCQKCQDETFGVS
jgi:hypothetical protein